MAEYLHLEKTNRKTLLDTMSVKDRMDELASESIQPSRVFRLLDGLDRQAVAAGSIASVSGAARHNIELYLSKLQNIKTALSGRDLVALGVPPGPQVKRLLDGLLDARLNGQISTRREEEEWVCRRIQADPKADC